MLAEKVPNTIDGGRVPVYDALDRLTSAMYNDLSSPPNELLGRNYTYDRYGNMTCGPGGSWTCNIFTPDGSTNRLINAQGNPVAYDAAGDVASASTGAGSYTYQWDAEGRLKSVDNGATRSFDYFANGLQADWVVPGATWNFVRAPSGTAVGLNNGSGWIDMRVPWNGGRFASYAGGGATFYHTNNLGSSC
jgi:YD repeat-containing protein